jgi:hypothetical protein
MIGDIPVIRSVLFEVAKEKLSALLTPLILMWYD